jgi:hypothetical protein
MTSITFCGTPAKCINGDMEIEKQGEKLLSFMNVMLRDSPICQPPIS